MYLNEKIWITIYVRTIYRKCRKSELRYTYVRYIVNVLLEHLGVMIDRQCSPEGWTRNYSITSTAIALGSLRYYLSAVMRYVEAGALELIDRGAKLSWDGDGRVGGQAILCLLCNPKCHYHAHLRLPLVAFNINVNVVHVLF